VEANKDIGIGFYVKRAYKNFIFRLFSLLLGALMMI